MRSPRLAAVALAVMFLAGSAPPTADGRGARRRSADPGGGRPAASPRPQRPTRRVMASHSPGLPSTIRIWEAWAKGFVTIHQGPDITFEVANNGPVDVVVDEHTMLMSPSPANPVEDVPGVDDETQDGTLTPTNTVAPGQTLLFEYGETVAAGSKPPPPWWCSEDSEFTRGGIPITLGGEILPYEMVRIIDPFDRMSQVAFWAHMRNNPTLVIGKTPLWQEVGNSGGRFEVTLAVTNIGFQDATGVVVTDSLPPGYSYDPTSFTRAPSGITSNPDGSTTLAWDLALIDAAVATSTHEPTEYTTVYLGYALLTPALAADIRVFLPRAYVDRSGDGVDDAESAEPLLETFLSQLCDIKPGSDRNPINMHSQGVIPVAIYGSAEFDPAEIDPTTVTFGPDGAAPAHKAMIHLEDVNEDGVIDALFHFRTQETGIQEGDVQACISWEMSGGDSHTCCDRIVTVPLQGHPRR